MGSNVHNQLQEKYSKLVLLALDKSDDIKDTTQLEVDGAPKMVGCMW